MTIWCGPLESWWLIHLCAVCIDRMSVAGIHELSHLTDRLDEGLNRLLHGLQGAQRVTHGLVYRPPEAMVARKGHQLGSQPGMRCRRDCVGDAYCVLALLTLSFALALRLTFAGACILGHCFRRLGITFDLGF